MSVERKMEKFSPFFPDNQPYCTRSGLIAGKEVVMDGNDVCWSYKFVDTLPDVDIFPHRICIPSVRIGSFQPGEVLTTEEVEGATRWVRLNAPNVGVGVVSKITCVYSADNAEIAIRWKDPEDVGRYVWQKTRVVRKYGDAPANENDGTIVLESTLKDQYFDVPFRDRRVPEITAKIYYRIFTYSADGVVTSDKSCIFEPLNPEWSEMSTHIQNGNAQFIFHIGDQITVTNGTRSFTFQVVDFDVATLTDVTKTRSVMLVSVDTVDIQYDRMHDTYVLVKDEIAPATGTKTYYKYDSVSAMFKPVRVPTGTHITAEDLIYVRETDTDSIAYGSNNWKTSASREYLNSLNISSPVGWLKQLKDLDTDFGNLILETANYLDGAADYVRFPSIDLLESMDLLGWSCTPDLETTYRVWYRKLQYGHTYTERTFAKESMASHVVIHIG